MASKWQDEFDLEDQPQPRSKPNPKNNKNSSNDDFYDLEDEAPKNVKLPFIGKQQPTSNEKHNKSTASVNLVEIPKRKQEASPRMKLEEEEEIFEESLAPSPQIKQKSPRVEPKKTVSPPKQEEEEEYANEDFEEDKYEQDFEAHEEHKPSPPQKPKEQPKQQQKAPSKPLNIPKPVTKDRRGAESVAKRAEPTGKPNSRNSVRSQSVSRSAHNSQAKAEDKKEEVVSKYTSLADKTCPNYERSTLEECNLDRLTRQNDKIRGLIKKFNDQLNDLINKNILQLKSKKEEKTVVPEEVIRVLEEQRNNNETALQNSIKDLQRLKGKEGELKEEEYQLGLEQKIGETKATMAELTKAITKLKLEVNNEGNKLTKIDKEKDTTTATQDANSIKSSIVLMKKEEEKNDEILERLYIKYEELSRKITEADGRHSNQLEQAKNKGLSVQLNPELVKKAQDTKKKIDVCKLHKSKTENLIKTKCEMINHECDQVRVQIKAVENSIQVCLSNCQEIQNEGRKIVEKARKNGKIPEDVLSSLENIISELESGTPHSNKDKDDVATFTHPKGAKKYQSQKNVEKVSPQPQPQPKEQTQDDINLKKPTLFKKKEREEEKTEQRVWKEDKNAEVKKHQKANSIPELAKFQNKEQGEKKDEEKKKPFVIKKNKQTKPESDTAIEPPKEESKVQKTEPKKQVEKTEEIPSIAPRMMKFRRNKQEEGKTEQPPKDPAEKPSVAPPMQKESPKNEQTAAQEEPERPLFAPKRFNLKVKDRNGAEEGGYVATTIQKKEEPKPVEEFKPKGLTIDKEPFTLAPTPEKKIEPLKALQPKTTSEQDEKPKFNLRLRDRQKDSNKSENQLEPPPSEPTKEPESRINIALDDKAKENNQYVNPYANAEAPKREREGPLKKQKPAQNVQKQNFNIYEQAEDITNVKEVKMGGESPKAPLPQARMPAEEPNLHDLLGIKKNKQTVDEDLLLDAALLGGKGPKGKRESKKDTNFFGDLEL